MLAGGRASCAAETAGEQDRCDETRTQERIEDGRREPPSRDQQRDRQRHPDGRRVPVDGLHEARRQQLERRLAPLDGRGWIGEQRPESGVGERDRRQQREDAQTDQRERRGQQQYLCGRRSFAGGGLGIGATGTRIQHGRQHDPETETCRERDGGESCRLLGNPRLDRNRTRDEGRFDLGGDPRRRDAQLQQVEQSRPPRRPAKRGGTPAGEGEKRQEAPEDQDDAECRHGFSPGDSRCRRRCSTNSTPTDSGEHRAR